MTDTTTKEESSRTTKLDFIWDDYILFTPDRILGVKPVYEKYFCNQHRPILKLFKMTEQSNDICAMLHSAYVALYKAKKYIKLVQRQRQYGSLDQTDKYLRDLGHFYTMMN